MATINAQNVNGAYLAEAAAGQLSALTWTAGSTTGDVIKFAGQRVLVLFRNSGASSRTVAVTSSPDPYNRKADIGATNIAAGAILSKIFAGPGWEQTTGGRDLAVTVNHAEVLIAAINLP